MKINKNIIMQNEIARKLSVDGTPDWIQIEPETYAMFGYVELTGLSQMTEGELR